MTVLFIPTTTTPEEEALRADVRAFVAEDAARHSARRPGLGIASEADPEFSRQLGQRGWLGMAIPRELGGHGRSAVDRFIMVEELMAVGAPVVGHWASDRQTGPALVHFGSPEQRARFIPGIVAGETFFSLGMSEPDAGSDLAAVRTKAVKTDGGWLVSGTKVWSSNAHRSHFFTVLCRTSASEDRHGGLSQLIVDLTSPGLAINPITFLDGTHHFNEVVMTDVFVPDDLVLGEVGSGWSQITSELAYERSGPDRYMSVQPVVAAFLRERVGAEPDPLTAAALGTIFGRMWGIRQMSLSVARAIDEGIAPAVQATLVKDLGTLFEQEAVELVRGVAGVEVSRDSSSMFESLLAEATVTGPSFTLRGGTNEVIRGVAAKALTPLGGTGPIGDPTVQKTIDQVLDERSTPEAVLAAETDRWAPRVWDGVADLGMHLLGVDEEVGGSGGTDEDALAVLRLAGYHAAPVPLAESGFLAGWLASRSGLAIGDAPQTAAQGLPGDRITLTRSGASWQLDAHLQRVPWAASAEHVWMIATDADGVRHVVAAPMSSADVTPGTNMAGEPRDTVDFTATTLAGDRIADCPDDVDDDALRLRGALSRATLIAGACQAAVDLGVVYTRQRTQFGRPIFAFQAVQHMLVRAAEESQLAGMAAAVAARSLGTPLAEFDIVMARVIASRAARVVATAIHQAHGAIGVTQEYELHLRTRRLWSWADEWGSEEAWKKRAGQLVARAGADGTWQLITASR